ncbi:Rpn family recombination-promoting nuclease/putative transposase [Sulfurovum sp. bin170]|uniref:Rpn family recombination-promoting nuclease/putative transposase n=1 Tax=Sulfurovum sp. bin170 TaxID=2695268 RepID=UPI0013E08D69|nr:Rpn family recombination-promoting nuclease/putative transposase [Sulfurovum sp. bin170]NEW60984.1 Rpn family recombination-promoting nuclease/putative transposase [Sulfurovum sp. bin170]
MEETTRLVSLDWAMKRLLRSKSNFKILEGFLTELICKKENDQIEDESLKKELKIIEILESESNQEHKRDKFNRVDIKIKDSNGEIIIVEIQFDSEYDYFHRMLYGTSKAMIEHLQLGEDYANIKKVISVNIVYFDLGMGKDYVYYGSNNFIGIHKQDELELSTRQKKKFNKISPREIYPEYYIVKVNKFDNIAKDSLDEWIYFLKNERVKSDFKAKGIKEAKKSLNYMKLKEEDRLAYSRYVENRRYRMSIANTKELDLKYSHEEGREEGKKEGREEGRVEGIEKGKKERDIEIVVRSLNQGLSVDIIASITGLSVGEIERIKERRDA